MNMDERERGENTVNGTTILNANTSNFFFILEHLFCIHFVNNVSGDVNFSFIK